MKINWNWSTFFRAVEKAVRDLKANKPLPPSIPPTDMEIVAGLTAFQARLPELIVALTKYPGAITGIVDILDALRQQGVPWAGDLETALQAAPGGLAAFENSLPTIIGLITAFSPAVDVREPTGIV